MAKLKLIKNKICKNYLILMTLIFLSEILTRIILNLEIFDWAVLRIFIGVNIVSLILSMLVSLLPSKLTNVFNLFIIFLVDLYAVAQVGFSNFMGNFMSVNSSSQLDKVTSYFLDYVQTFSWEFYLIFIPFIILIVYYIFFNKKIKHIFDYSHYLNYLLTLIPISLLCWLFYVSLDVNFMKSEYQAEKNSDLFKYPENPNVVFNQFGSTIYAIIDFKSLLGEASAETINNNNDNNNQDAVINDYTRVINDYSWRKVMENEKNSNYKKLNEYFINRDITDKNEMTGYLKDKNLIFLLLESVNTIPFMYPEYFPNLNKIYNEGWTWTNSYTPRNSCSTGNNEMTALISLYSISYNCTANIYRNNTYFQSIFNLFNSADYQTTSYHDYADHYYYRNTIHINMGSSKYYNAYKLGIKVNAVYEEWPSDVDLFENSFKYYSGNDKFMAFMATVTTHRPYTVYSEYGNKHLKLFKDLNISTAGKRYLSKVKELDMGIGTLLAKLEASGELDDTVIVIFGDHYPYGLSNTQLQQFFSYDVINNQYERDRTPFAIYNSQMVPTKYDDYTSIINIVPTLANLFDLNYDPRYYMGVDLFSDDYKSMVVYADGSWQNEAAFYNASKGKITYKNTGVTLDSNEIVEVNKKISNDIKMSSLAITKNYFNYLEKALAKYPAPTPVEETTEDENPGS